MRVSICLGLVVVATVASLAAQGAKGQFCLRAQPKPDCSAFLLTNAGAYVVLGGPNGRETAARGVFDYGFMVNLNTRDAVGASVFASLDREGFAAGPSVRYRRWLTATSSFEVALGKPVAGDPSLQTGAVFGLVKWSPNHWFAVAARPEIIRGPVCGPTTCVYQSQGRVSLGAEAGAVPGLVITGAAGAAFLAFLAILAGSLGD
jgi:hypothetical protein